MENGQEILGSCTTSFSTVKTLWNLTVYAGIPYHFWLHTSKSLVARLIEQWKLCLLS